MQKTWAALAAVLTLAAAGASAQDSAAGGPGPQPRFSPEQLLALYQEAAATHDGMVYTVDVARFSACAEAQQLAAQLESPVIRSRPLHQVTQVRRYTDRFTFAMEPELRAQVRTMRERERTGVIRLAGGECMIAEIVERKAQRMPPPEMLAPLLAPLVQRGWLPHPDSLARDPTLRMRTAANRLRSVAAIDSLPAGFDFNTRRSDGFTVLMGALFLGQADLARAVLQRGANPNLCGPEFCPLALALRVRNDDEAWELLELLLQAGADPNQFDPAQRTRWVPLAEAAVKGPRFAERLVKAGANVNGIPEAQPPLYLAAALGKQNVVEYLLAQGADPFASDPSRAALRSTAYVAAQESQNPRFAEWMENRMMDIAAKSGRYAFEAWLEQDGRRVTASGGAVRLKRAPFRVVARLVDSTVGLVIASSQSTAFQDDVRSSSTESAVFRPVSTGAEENDGTSDWLYVLSAAVPSNDGVIQFWFWNSERERRFSGRRSAGRATEYYRDIRTITLMLPGHKSEDIPLAKYDGGDLYLVVAAPVYLSPVDYRFIKPQFMRVRFE